MSAKQTSGSSGSGLRRASDAPYDLRRCTTFSSSSALPGSRTTATARSLSMRHSWMTQAPTVLLAAFRMTLSPGFSAPKSSSSRYATHISPAQARQPDARA